MTKALGGRGIWLGSCLERVERERVALGVGEGVGEDDGGDVALKEDGDEADDGDDANDGDEAEEDGEYWQSRM